MTSTHIKRLVGLVAGQIITRCGQHEKVKSSEGGVLALTELDGQARHPKVARNGGTELATPARRPRGERCWMSFTIEPHGWYPSKFYLAMTKLVYNGKTCKQTVLDAYRTRQKSG